MINKILIIGATSAIAQESAKLLVSDTNAFYLVGRNESRLKIIADDMLIRGASSVTSMALDLDDLSKHSSLIYNAIETLGGLDAVLIAHGILGDQKECESNYTAAEKIIKVNFLSVVSLLTIIANYFEKQQSGCIAVISSVAGERGRQSNYVYGTSKGAVSLFLQGLRNRLHSSGVNVITIKPGFVDTPMTAHFKKGLLWVKPEIIAKGLVKAIKKRKDIVFIPCYWNIVALIIKHIPEKIFKKLKL